MTTNPENLFPRPLSLEYDDLAAKIWAIWPDGRHMFIDMRGWGYLTGTLSLSGKDARAIQDKCGRLICELYNVYAHPTPPEVTPTIVNSKQVTKSADNVSYLPEDGMSAESLLRKMMGMEWDEKVEAIQTRDAQLSQATGELPEIKDVAAVQHHRPDIAPDAMVCYLSAPGYRQMKFDNATIQLNFPTCAMRVLDWLHNYKLPTALQASDEV